MSKLLIDIRNCSIYRDQPILNGVTLQIAPFEHTAVLGPNGSGKSTLIRLLTREFYPSRIDDIEPVNLFMAREDWSQAELRQAMGVVSGNLAGALLSAGAMDVHDALASAFFGTYGFLDSAQITKKMEREILRVMDTLDLTQLSNHLLDTLSTGELRKVLIGRAMILNPQLLLLDEPSLGLDIAAQTDFMKYISRVSKSATILMVTHHLEEIIPEIKNVLMLKDGRVFAFGSKKEMLTGPRISGLFDTSIEVKTSPDGVYSMHRV